MSIVSQPEMFVQFQFGAKHLLIIDLESYSPIEGLWAHAKKPFKAMNGTSKSLFDSHLEWFQFKRVHSTLFFANLMFWIRFYYGHGEKAMNADVIVE